MFPKVVSILCLVLSTSAFPQEQKSKLPVLFQFSQPTHNVAVFRGAKLKQAIAAGLVKGFGSLGAGAGAGDGDARNGADSGDRNGRAEDGSGTGDSGAGASSYSAPTTTITPTALPSPAPTPAASVIRYAPAPRVVLRPAPAP